MVFYMDINTDGPVGDEITHNVMGFSYISPPQYRGSGASFNDSPARLIYTSIEEEAGSGGPSSHEAFKGTGIVTGTAGAFGTGGYGGSGPSSNPKIIGAAGIGDEHADSADAIDYILYPRFVYGTSGQYMTGLNTDDGFYYLFNISSDNDTTINNGKKRIFENADDASGSALNISHDGTLITFVKDGDIYIGDFPGVAAIVAGTKCSNVRNLTGHASTWDGAGSPGVVSYDPVFSNDDRKVFFKTQFREASDASKLDWKLQYSDLYPEQATYDPDMAHPPTYKYWVLRVPVSFPEYT
jgi:hypothetical protein